MDPELYDAVDELVERVDASEREQADKEQAQRKHQTMMERARARFGRG